MKQLVVLPLVILLEISSLAQILSRRPAAPAQPKREMPVGAPPIMVPLDVPVGTPLKIVLDGEVRIHEVGQPIRGRVVEPVYAFQKLVIPEGTQAKGEISELSHLSKKTRILAALNANFSPTRQVRITFNELQFSDGRRIPISTEVSPNSGGILQLISASEKASAGPVRNAISRRVAAAKQEVQRDLERAKAEIGRPGKLHRLKRLGLGQLPYHSQFLESGENFTADLSERLQFGRQTLPAESLAAIGTVPPSGAVLHADLMTSLTSASNKKGDRVEAVITKPLFSGDRLLIPQGSRLQGTISQVRPARRLARNGLLRIEFQKMVPPNGIEEKITATLNAVEVAQKEHLALDSEGGAQVTSPKSRYLSTGIAVALAASSGSDEHDHDGDLRQGGGGGNGLLTGASGFGVIGMVCGAVAHSRIVSRGFGFYGAGISFYAHFIARGSDVVYPKDMGMLISLTGNQTPRAALY